MKKIVERTFDAIVGLLMFGCIFGGIILMMCETPDWERQVSTIVLGFVLFCIGTIPGACTALMTNKKEEENERTYRT